MRQIDLLKHAVDALERIRIPYMIVSSYACFAYGESRTTQDIDIVIELFPSQIKPLFDAFPAPDFYVSEQAIRDALKYRSPFNILHPSSSNKIDFLFPRDNDWGRSQFERKTSARILPDQPVSIACPEDIIVGKLWFYSEGGSDKHLRDIASILKISGDSIRRPAIEKWARQYGYTSVWEKCLSKLAESQAPKE
jgi:hypothetical protein